MAAPKYLKNKPVKTPYNFRTDKRDINQLTEIAKNLDISTAKLLNRLIKTYLEGKTAYNTYLQDTNSFIIKVPLNPLIKADLITKVYNYHQATNLRELYKDNDTDFIVNTYIEINEDYLINLQYSQEDYYIFNTYEVNSIPNNLDKFNKDTESFTGIKDDLHTGIEFLIIPEAADDTDFNNCLYVLYFKLMKGNVLGIYLIDFNEAINILKQGGYNELCNLAESIHYKLNNAADLEEVKEMAAKYNTGNITEFNTTIKEEAEPINYNELINEVNK